MQTPARRGASTSELLLSDLGLENAPFREHPDTWRRSAACWQVWPRRRAGRQGAGRASREGGAVCQRVLVPLTPDDGWLSLGNRSASNYR